MALALIADFVQCHGGCMPARTPARVVIAISSPRALLGELLSVALARVLRTSCRIGVETRLVGPELPIQLVERVDRWRCRAIAAGAPRCEARVAGAVSARSALLTGIGHYASECVKALALLTAHECLQPVVDHS